jgi:hypothetical protein
MMSAHPAMLSQSAFHAYAAPSRGLPAPRFWLTYELTTVVSPRISDM